MNIPTLPFPVEEIEMIVVDGHNTAVYNRVGRRVALDSLDMVIAALIDCGARMIRRQPRNGQRVIDVVERNSERPGLVDDVYVYRTDWVSGDPVRRLAGYNPKSNQVLVTFGTAFVRHVTVSVEATAAIEAAIVAEPELRNGRLNGDMFALHSNRLVDALPPADQDVVIAAAKQLRNEANAAHQRRLQEAQSRPPLPTSYPRQNPVTGRFMRGGDGRRRMRF